MAAITFRPYQVEAAAKLAAILAAKQFALDGSDTGIGKTFTAIATALEFVPSEDPKALPPVAVICRARAQTKWREALAMFNIKPVFLMSWEKARSPKNGFFMPVKNNRGKVTTFSLRLEKPTVLIIDEIHAGGAIKSQNAELVIAARRCPNAMVLGLSATPADSPLKMRALGFCCGLHELGESFWNWCRRNGCGKSPFGGLYFRNKDRERVLGSLHATLFAGKDPWGIRLRKKALMDAGQFPESETFVELWDIGSAPAWLKPYMDEIDRDEDADMDRHNFDPHAGILAMRDRQRAELSKVPALLEEIQDRVDEGESVAVFVQFTRTIQVISSQLKVGHSILAGGRSRKEADEHVRKFQANENKIIVCQVDAGSESIDLHDTVGGHPRHVIIFPTYKSVTLIQVLGRVVRSGAKSPAVQRIVYAAGGIEEKIAKAVEKRLENLSMLSDGELNAGGMI
jgi:superfamily II DNA or RNA helicase